MIFLGGLRAASCFLRQGKPNTEYFESRISPGGFHCRNTVDAVHRTPFETPPEGTRTDFNEKVVHMCQGS
jgi:hypothetical protein